MWSARSVWCSSRCFRCFRCFRCDGYLMLICFCLLSICFCCSRPRVGSRPRAVQRRTGAGASAGACRVSEGSSRPWVSDVEQCVWAGAATEVMHGTRDVRSKRQGRLPGRRQCVTMCSERLGGRAGWCACLGGGSKRSFLSQYAQPYHWSMSVSQTCRVERESVARGHAERTGR